nr:MAG TPA: hypothetical protein [Bacteriophage sp.]
MIILSSFPYSFLRDFLPGYGSCILQLNIITPIFNCVLSASRTI